MSAAVIAIGTAVRVVDGLARGLVGTVRDVALWEWEPGIPVLAVEFPELGLRVIRADYLQPVGVAS